MSPLHLLFQVEKTCSSNPSELLLYPAKEHTKTSSPLPAVNSNSSSAPVPTSNIPADKPSHSPAQQRPPSTHLTRSGSRSPQSPPSSSSSPSPPSSPATLSPDLKLKLEELLEKYSNGLWAHALPKLFQDTYKVSIPLKHYHIKVITEFRSELFIYICFENILSYLFTRPNCPDMYWRTFTSWPTSAPSTTRCLTTLRGPSCIGGAAQEVEEMMRTVIGGTPQSVRRS